MADRQRKNEVYREWYARNKQKKLKQVSERYIKISKEAHRRYNLKKCYNLDWEDYLDLYKQQEGCCAICGVKKLPFKVNDLQKRTDCMYVDHDHITMKVRGLLCHHCNTLLGQAKDSTIVLANAIKYLSKETLNDN